MATDSPEIVRHVKSVSAGGESVTVDNNAAKADERACNLRDKQRIANRQVRPFTGKILFRGIYG